jgi:hypothetical protein
LLAAGQARASKRAPAADAGVTDSDRRACMAAFVEGRHRLENGHLREAKHLFSTCADPACGRTLERACVTRQTQLETDIPSIVPLLLDRAGRPVVDVDVTLDGQPLTSQLDGRAWPVDPGLHELAFSTGGDAVSTKVLIAQGQRNHVVTVSSSRDARKEGRAPAAPITAAVEASADEAPVERPRRWQTKRPAADADDEAADDDDDRDAKDDRSAKPRQSSRKRSASVKSSGSAATEKTASTGSSSVPLYLLGGLGVAGLVGYGTLVTWARNDNQRLLDCTPNCPQASVDHIRKLYRAADISLGVGVASLVATTWIYVVTRPNRKEMAYSFDLRLTPSGAVAGLGGRF